MPVVIMVVIAIDTVSAVALSSYIRSYPLALSTIKLKLTSPSILSKVSIMVVNQV